MVAVDVRATADRQRMPNRGVEVGTLEINDGDNNRHRKHRGASRMEGRDGGEANGWAMGGVNDQTTAQQ
ncbi:hypothetical protein E2562_019708 [Oryza meyeriana var. granulata]|uniref:DUF834 domain-containing protein n=1 Tax=Oryza meyeriana var. granulata TaxID=110450 RepID=A0A6G1C7Y0_9ORYZ|nr:hypothetical protein E2562_019708 [Oryza meyeriana var. granulata]